MKLGLLLTLLIVAPAQADVLVVDDDGGADHTEIRAAVLAAQDGDLILVRAGTYERVVVDGKELSIVGLEDGVVITGDYPAEAPLEIRNLAASQHVLVSRLQATNQSKNYVGLIVTANDGPVVLEDLTLFSTASAQYHTGPVLPAFRVVNSASVGLLRCELAAPRSNDHTPGVTGLFVNASSVYLHDSLVIGGRGDNGEGIITPNGEDGGTGVVVEDGSLFAARSWLRGGAGGPSGDGLIQQSGGDGGVGLSLGPGVTAVLHDVKTEGGAGGFGFPTSGVDGAPTAVDPTATLTVLGGNPRVLSAPPSVASGAPVRLRFTGTPGEAVELGVSQSPAPTLVLAEAGVAVPASPVTQPSGVVPHTGFLTIDLGSDLPLTTTTAEVLFVQPRFVDPGGTALLGTPRTLLVLGPEF